jgi:hypothetical protein
VWLIDQKAPEPEEHHYPWKALEHAKKLRAPSVIINVATQQVVIDFDPHLGAKSYPLLQRPKKDE